MMINCKSQAYYSYGTNAEWKLVDAETRLGIYHNPLTPSLLLSDTKKHAFVDVASIVRRSSCSS